MFFRTPLLATICRRFSTTSPLPQPPAKLNYVKLDSPNPSAKLNLLAVHPLLGSSKDLYNIVKNPKIANYANSYLIDLRNHGQSELRDTMTLAEMAGDIASLIKDLKLRNLVILGHSLGGRVTMRCCTDYPELIKAAIVVDTLGIDYYKSRDKFPTTEDSRITLNKLNNVNLNRNLNEIRDDLEKFMGARVDRFMKENLILLAAGGYKWKFHIEAIAKGYQSIVEIDLAVDQNRRYGGNVKIIFGDKSGYVFKDELKSYEKIFSNFNETKDAEMIRQAGHYVYYSQPEAFIDSVSEFLQLQSETI